RKMLSEKENEIKVFLIARQVLKITALKKPAESAPDTVLVPGRAAPAAEPLKVIQINPSQVEVYNGWRDNLMRFEGNTFNEIVKILERKYDVTIILNDESLKNYKYTGTFKNINDVTKVLNIIRETTPIRYAVNERVINIEPTKKQ